MMNAEEIKSQMVRLIECPRDAMQGWSRFIPTEKKIEYLNALLQVGFDTLDFGSFVSPKAIPQMADTKEVIEKLNTGNSKTKLLAIVANTRGAEDAALFSSISDIGFPFSISESFQKRNTNATIAESVETVSAILEICHLAGKRLVVYISMAFGNPYGDEYSTDIAIQWVGDLVDMGVKIISLADTVGLANPSEVNRLASSVIQLFPAIECGVHLHSRPENRLQKIEAAFQAGCFRFDGAIKGFGGCPMAGDELVGNMDSLLLIDYFREKNLLSEFNEKALNACSLLANEIFLNH